MEKDAYPLAGESHQASPGVLTHGPHLRAALHQRSDRAERRTNNRQLFVALTRQIPPHPALHADGRVGSNDAPPE